jgi:hypothetical protein
MTKKLWQRLTKNKSRLDPVLQKLKTTHHALWMPEEVRHAQDNDGFCERMLAALQGVQSKFTKGMASRHDFDMFSISEQGVLMKAETREAWARSIGGAARRVAIGCDFTSA